MKITNTTSVQTDYASLNIRAKGLSGSHPKKKDFNFDAISIQSNPREIAEKTFAATISKQIAGEIRIPVSENRVQELKDTVSLSGYQPDPSLIASRMLLVGGAAQ